MTASDYLNQIVNFGGIPTPLHRVYAEMKTEGHDAKVIDYYVMGLMSNPRNILSA